MRPDPSDHPKRYANQMKRRRFIRWSWIIGAVVVLGGQFAFLLKRFLTASAPDVPKGPTDIGPQEQFSTTSVTHFRKEGFLLVHQQGKFLALSHQCTHNRCQVNYASREQVIICPCHSSLFSLTGSVLRGPARRPLQRYPVTLQDGRVVVELPG